MLDLQLWVNISSVLGSLSLVVSVLLLLREVRQTNLLTRAANAQTLVEMSSPYYLGVVQDRALAELFLRGAKDSTALDEVDRHRYRTLLIWWLIFYENIFYQRQQHLLDRHAYGPWWRDLELFVREHNLPRHWDTLQGLFQEEFARKVGEVVAKVEGEAAVTALRR